MKKLYTVTKPFMPSKKEFKNYLDEIWENEWLTNNGPIHKKFEQSLEEYLKADNITLTVNGHSALDTAIKGLELKGEVITTPFTFASTTHSLTLNNITPVFCDIKESDLTIDEDKIEDLITDKTTAIMPVHVYGHMCNIERIEEIAKRHNLKVIYDAAHTFGVNYKGKAISNYGDVSMLSFHATKIFHTIEGGALIYNDKKMKQTFETLKNFGIEGEETINFVGGNSKMNEFQASMGLINLKHIDKLIEERKKITLYYRKLLKELNGIKFFEPENLYKDYNYNYSYLPILIENRDEVYKFLKKYNIYTRKYFYPIVPEFGCYKEKYKDTKVPVAKKISSQVLCLPLYNGLKKEDVDFIVDKIKIIMKTKGKNYAKS